MELAGYASEYWWGNPEIPTSVHRLTHSTRPTLFVKIAPSLQREYERLAWCQGKLPVPEVVAFDRTADGDRLITRAVDGVAAHDRLELPDRDVAARALAAAWRAVHDLPADGCPFDSRPATLMEEVRLRLTGAEATAIWDSARGSTRDAADVFDELVASQPPSGGTVVVHGDASVPNVIVKDAAVVGIVDVGMLGRGDLWWDLTTCLGSMAREDNDLSSVQDLFMDAYGMKRDPDRERWFRLLYRLVFDLPAGRARSD